MKIAILLAILAGIVAGVIELIDELEHRKKCACLKNATITPTKGTVGLGSDGVKKRAMPHTGNRILGDSDTGNRILGDSDTCFKGISNETHKQ